MLGVQQAAWGPHNASEITDDVCADVCRTEPGMHCKDDRSVAGDSVLPNRKQEPFWVEELRRDMKTIFRNELSDQLQAVVQALTGRMDQKEREKYPDMETSRTTTTNGSDDSQTILTEPKNSKRLIESAITKCVESVRMPQLSSEQNKGEGQVSGTHPTKCFGKCFGNEISFGTGVQDPVVRAVLNHDIHETRNIVNAGFDPNTEFPNVTVKGTVYNHISLVAAAVRVSDLEMVDFLVAAKADPESKYGICVGPSHKEWCAPAAFMAISLGNIPMLRSLLHLRASLEAVASDNTNMVWHAAHYDKVEELKFLLDREVSWEEQAESYDKPGVTYTPLHVAIVRGNVRCVPPLLHVKACVNRMNEENCTPLHDAIKYCQPRVVCSLVSSGADLVQRVRSFSRSSAMKLNLSSVLNVDNIEPFDLLIRMKNPILLCAAAVGIQQQPDLATIFSLEDVFSILATPGNVKVEFLRAIFVCRKLRYRDSFRGVHQIKTAVLGMDRGTPSYPIFPHVVSSYYSSGQLEDVFRARSEPDSDMKQFLHTLAPQEREPKNNANCHVPVRVYECMIPCMHKDLHILGALAGISAHNDIWLEDSCWAIFTAAWCKILWIVKIDAACHILSLGLFCLIAYYRMERNRSGSIGVNYPSNINIVAGLGLILWLYELFYEIVQFWAALRLGQLVHHLRKFKRLIDAAHLVACVILLIHFCIWDGKDDGYNFRILFGVYCFFEWVITMWTLSPFRKFGFWVLPLLSAMREIGPFAVMMMIYLSGVAHAFTAWDFLKEHTSITILSSFFFGMLGDPDGPFWEIIYDPSRQNLNQYFIRTLIVFILAFLVPVTLMNLFIAQLGYSYHSAMDMREKLYRHRVAQSVASKCNTYYAVQKVFRTKGATSRNLWQGGNHLWYCVDHSAEFEKGIHQAALASPGVSTRRRGSGQEGPWL